MVTASLLNQNSELSIRRGPAYCSPPPNSPVACFKTRSYSQICVSQTMKSIFCLARRTSPLLPRMERCEIAEETAVQLLLYVRTELDGRFYGPNRQLAKQRLYREQHVQEWQKTRISACEFSYRTRSPLCSTAVLLLSKKDGSTNRQHSNLKIRRSAASPACGMTNLYTRAFAQYITVWESVKCDRTASDPAMITQLGCALKASWV